MLRHCERGFSRNVEVNTIHLRLSFRGFNGEQRSEHYLNNLYGRALS